MHTEQTQPVSLRELASTLFIYKWTILALTLVFGVGAAVVSMFMPNVYESSVQMWAQDQSPGLRGTSKYAEDSAARLKIVLSNVREVILSRQVLLATLEQSGATGSAAGQAGIQTGAETSLDAEIAELRKSIRLEAPKGSDFGTTPIFFVRLRDNDPDRASKLLAALLASFRQRYEALTGEQAQHLYTETTLQVDKSREQLADAAKSFDAFVRDLEGNVSELNSMGGSPGDSELRRGLATVNERLVPAEADAATQTKLLEQFELARAGSDESPVVPGTFVRDYPAFDLAARELSATRIQMDATEARLTPEHPEFQVAAERLRFAEMTYRDEIERVIEAVRRDIAAKSEAITFLRNQKDEYLGRLAALADRFVEFDGLKQELAQRRLIVADAERRRSDAAHALLTAAQETLFATMDGPQSSVKPVSPKRKLNIALGTLLGLLTGVGLAFLARNYSQVVRSESDLAELADDLMIVSVPKVRTPLQKAS
jgi:uncharacterized protein involved in exopolysaccharide biosynthesis